ncbi:MAG: hypothetical protein HY652_10420, partial [Acidobacteria bacterium]|nr:hypothetical protein [Acidobacteriota bacterium]
EETREAFALRGVSRTEWAGSFVEPLPAESPVAVATEPAVAELPAIEMAPQGHGDPLVETVVQQVLSRLSERVIREIAWEVVPELAESLIKEHLKKEKREI